MCDSGHLEEYGTDAAVYKIEMRAGEQAYWIVAETAHEAIRGCEGMEDLLGGDAWTIGVVPGYERIGLWFEDEEDIPEKIRHWPREDMGDDVSFPISVTGTAAEWALAMPTGEILCETIP